MLLSPRGHIDDEWEEPFDLKIIALGLIFLSAILPPLSIPIPLSLFPQISLKASNRTF